MHRISKPPSGLCRRFLCALVLAFAASSVLAANAPDTNGTLCVMSYNLRFASPTGPNAWPQRCPLMGQLLQSVSPDILGTQEGLYPQLKDLAARLPDYEWLGVGREGGSKGEFMAVFYRKARLDPVAFDHFWLSDTPDVIGSSTWGNTCRRMVTWIRFLDRQTKKEFYLFNTHFDHQVQSAREKSAELVRRKIQELNTTSPIILTGDFNANANNKAYKLLVADDFFSDTWTLAKERRGEGLGTFNGFKAVAKNNNRIDWILARGKVAVDAEEIVTLAPAGQFPSDHCPLVAWLRLGD